ncbi:exonuclease [Mesorhizobium sp. WSM4312]|uniref:exonuclease domain-containing protein n=1 Tax=unclassified Mesorhizobium TaxID=325217 RepID=UPI000BAFA9D5|nr:MULTISPECIES: exonuclease domain-containing protein [unclassified Mesorhizobium]PBB66037.1 exonuclease [Mesorhizobium sp. WSM4312]PBC20224.1 exonuclease [Mesorhizobium sp. WSM4311]TRC95878.1 exonuclease [Mesorhizobium sp. WSM4305]
MKLPVLPVYYYHDHFTEMLGFVSETYGAVLTHRHRAFIETFATISKDAQCLLIRMINRRGVIFRQSAFRYAEISNAKRAVAELRTLGYVRSLAESDYAHFIVCHPKDALIQGAKNAGLAELRTSWAKGKLVDYYLANVTFETAYQYCGGDDFIALGDTAPIEFLLYLYFGKTEQDLKNFALRDLGILRTNKNANLSARFTDADEAHASFHFSRLLDGLEVKSEPTYRAAISAILGGPQCTTDYAADLKSKAAHKAGQYFEKSDEKELAIQLYRAGSSFDCNERLARLLYSTGDKKGSEELLRRMIDDPASDDEFVFANDFYARKFNGRRTGLCTELLRAGRTITVDDSWRGNPEAGVAGVMRRQGCKVFYAENTLWHCLFGLLFWDELFESGQLHSSFDWMPHCLKDKTFARLFAKEIGEKLAAVASQSALTLVLRTIAGKWGTPNGIFAWDYVDMDAIRPLLAAHPGGVSTMLRLMCEDFRAMRDGFPDLMTELNGEVAFLEVKAEGDAVRRSQLTRLRQLGGAGIKADIARVDFRFDPEQEYVVVDIETTGSWSNGDRVTEIGAVKIRNHEIVDEWSSLINPQRLIPAMITRLTGITNDMVRNAPPFAEVADEFMQFMGEGIFVAHNVNFDYGFLSSEYERLERRFRFPKLCTCATMRRQFPGHKSYGLGSLCEAYDINLKDHHRALCDARAAAHLLNLINGKRDIGPSVLAEQAA